jgi:type VI secretion system protein ImpL
VLLAISLEDLLTLPEAEIHAHADAISARLLELHERLKVDFPVYALFTKADLVAGFMEYFGDLRESERRMVWGATFQTADKTRNMIGEVPHEFDGLIERLNEGIPDRLQEQPDHRARVLLFGLPAQMMALKRPLVEFLNRIFEPTRYHAKATLRGFYFTSGTQQGTPIDQLIGAMARSFGTEQVAPTAYSGLGKSFFLTDLLQKVVIGEAGWVSTNRAAARRSLIGRVALYSLLVTFATICVGLWSLSFVENRTLVARAGRAVADYRARAASLLQQTSISDHDLGKVLQLLLHPLRFMPAGYETRDTPIPLNEQFGLSQRRRLESASMAAYSRVLERTLRSRLLLRLEEQLQANIGDPAYVYEALKVYLMLGGREKSDDELIVAWMRRDWADNLYPGTTNAAGRKALEEHLRAMLDLDEGLTPSIQLNGPLVEEAQKTLARMSVADRAYALLKSQAQTSSFPDWVVAERGGPDLGTVFEAADGEDLEQLRVPGFFTYQGFRQGFLGRLGDIAKRIESEQWVLGDIGSQAAVTAQYETLPKDLLVIYGRDFIASWDSVLNKLRLRPLAADKPRYAALSAAAGEISPIRQLLQSIRDETQLTRKPPEPASGEAGAPAVLTTGGEKAQIAEAGAGPALGFDDKEQPGAAIETYFRPLHALVEGEPGQQPIDDVIKGLGSIRENLVLAAVSPVQADQATAALPAQITDLRTSAARLPSPFSAIVMAGADNIEAAVTGAAVAQLSQAFNAQVTQACQQIITNRYPFFPGSDRDVPLQDFSRLFGPSGIIDGFFNQHLASLVDMTKSDWTWRSDSLLARGLSADALKQFQRAAEIRDAFFAGGGNTPSVTFTVTPVTVPDTAEAAVLKINAATIESQPGVSAPAAAEWPGANPDNHAAIALRGGSFGTVSILERRGAWALYRLLDAGSVLKRGDGFVATFKVEGEEVAYRFDVNSINNPLLLPALRQFRCPTGL